MIPDLRALRFMDFDFFSRMCRIFARLNLTLPVPVKLKRFFELL